MFNLDLDSINKRHAEANEQIQMSLEAFIKNMEEIEELHEQSKKRLVEINKMLDGLNF
jgi:hypothetical protein